MKRTLLLLIFGIGIGMVGWGQYSGTGTFNKITSLTDLTDGYYVVAYGTTFAMNNTNAGTYFGNTAITPVSNTLTDPATTVVWKIQTHIDGGRTIYSEASSKYVSYTGSSNAAYAVASVTGGSERWTFAWSSTVFTCTNVTSSTRLLQYNTGSPRFACYTGSQQNLTLYKLSGNTPPTVTTQAVTSIGTTTATGNGNITATGGVAPTFRGFCWGLASGGDPDTLSFSNTTETGTFTTGAFTGSITSLTAGTQYKVRAYATNTLGVAYGSVVTFYTLSTEPTNHPSSFTAAANSQTSITTTWNDNDPEPPDQNASGYLIFASTTNSFTDPVDGVAQTDDNNLADGSGKMNIAHGIQTYAWTTGLSAGTPYYFKIFAYNGSGTTINYKTDPTGPTTSATTTAALDATSEVSGPALGSQPNPTLISSLADTDGEALRVFDMDVYDYGTDGQPTKITQLTIKAGSNNDANWATVIQGVKLSINGGTSFVTTGTPTIGASSIVIPVTSGNLNVPDADGINIWMYIYLNTSGLTDNQILEFKVDATAASHGFVADATGSTFLATFVTAPVSNQILVDVVGTKLAFVQQPTNVGTSANITPAVTVSANDANGNRDLNYVTNVSITATGATLIGSPVSATPVSGLATFSTLSFSTTGIGVTLSATSGSLTGTTSSSFDVILLPAAGEIIINQFSSDYSAASNEYIELLNKTSKTFDLSLLKIEYQSSGGSGGSAGGNLSGSLGPYQYWLLSPDATITVGQTSGLTRDGSITAGFAATSGQLALRLKNAPNTIIDGLAYGTVSPNNLGEGTSASSPPADGGLKRTTDGSDNNANSTDFSTVTQANIYLRNHNSINVSSSYTLPSISYSADVVISNSATVQLTGATTISGKLTIISGVMNIASDKTLTVNGTLTNSGNETNLIIESDASGTGSLICNQSVLATVKRYLTQNYYHYISSPVAAQAISREFINTDDYLPSEQGHIDLFKWDETTNTWDNIKQDETNWDMAFGANFAVAKGYVYAYRTSDVIKNFTGAINVADQTINLTVTPDKSNGWNIVGNPFSSTMAANSGAQATDNLIAVNAALFADGGYTALYFWDESMSDYVPKNDVSDAYFVNPGQAFMIKAKTHNTAFAFNATMRKHGTSPFYKSTNSDDYNRFTLAVTGPQGDINETLIGFVPGTSTGLDEGFDAIKRKGNTNIALYSKLVNGGAGDFAIQALPQSSANEVVAISLDANKTGTYIFKAGAADNMEYFTVKLEDRLTGTFTTLEGSAQYSFAVLTAGKIENRFFLHFKSSVGIEDPAATQKAIYSSGHNLYFETSGNATLDVFNLTGQKTESRQINSSGLHTISINAPTGWYIVKLITGNEVKSQKVFIN